MKNLTLQGVIILALYSVISCDSYVHEKGDGHITTQERAVENFDEVEVGGNFKVILRKSSKPGLTITVDQNLHEYIKVRQKRGRLQVSTERSIKSNKGVKLLIEYVDLKIIGSSGVAIIESDGIISGDYLRLQMSGAGTMSLLLDVEALKVNISGAGMVRLKGTAVEQNIQMSGAGGLEAYNLVSQSCQISISGVGGAGIHVKKELKASVSGVGGINYRGNPDEVVSEVSGLGTISKDDGAVENEEI